MVYVHFSGCVTTDSEWSYIFQLSWAITTADYYDISKKIKLSDQINHFIHLDKMTWHGKILSDQIKKIFFDSILSPWFQNFKSLCSISKVIINIADIITNKLYYIVMGRAQKIWVWEKPEPSPSLDWPLISKL